jgi:alkanesulfonate monooxygenase SsuD/methylene tetrahydromethanopterin reductase-like flavin-dependent oxidoreductase (luciferase family)
MDGKTPRWVDILAMARRAEEVGFDSVWVSDHLMFRIRSRLGPSWRLGPWECWSMIAALAASTTRAEVGTLVLCTGFRNPALLAKMADTVDEISGGRLILGLGAGYHEPEYRAFGYPYDRRVSRFEEALTITATLLRKGKIDFQGKYYQVRDCELRPRGPRPAGPPIMVGTMGERMLRLTAKQADLWNAWLIYGDSRPDQLPSLRAKVDAACAEVGRDPATLGRTTAIAAVPPGQSTRMTDWLQKLALRAAGIDPIPLAGTAEALAEGIRDFARQGISHVQVFLQPNSLAAIESFAPVLQLLDRPSASQLPLRL